MSVKSSTFTSQATGLITVVILAPPCAFFGLVAAYFLAQQFLAGWIPSRWFSGSAADWIFADGTEGGASNYFGFMVCALPAALCGKGVEWGYERFKGRHQ